MTKLLEQAIAAVRELSEAEQDAAAEALFAHMSGDHHQVQLTQEQVAEIKQIQQDLHDGRSRLLTDAEMETFWKKCGL
jgi:hypothetical protein